MTELIFQPSPAQGLPRSIRGRCQERSPKQKRRRGTGIFGVLPICLFEAEIYGACFNEFANPFSTQRIHKRGPVKSLYLLGPTFLSHGFKSRPVLPQ